MTQQQLVITRDDVVWMFKLDIVPKFYISSKGLSPNDFEGVHQRQQILATHWLLVLKAFFCPSHVLKFIPSDLANSMPYQDPGMLEIMQKNLPKANDIILSALGEITKQIRRFSGMNETSFKNSLTFMGYANRLDTLTMHFKLPEDDVIPLLFAIINATTTISQQPTNGWPSKAKVQSPETQETIKNS